MNRNKLELIFSLFKELIILPVILTYIFHSFRFLNCQDTKELKKIGIEHFKYEAYKEAIEALMKVYAKDPSDAEIAAYIGLAYTIGYVDRKSKAIPYLERAVEAGVGGDSILFYLALAYHYSYNFDKAIELYQNFIKSKGKENLKKIASRNIRQCEIGKELIKHPRLVRISNLGKKVNSEAPDYYPYVTPDEQFLFFNSRRNERNMGYQTADLFKTSDVYVSQAKSGEWQTPQSAGAVINSIEDDEICGLSWSGNIIFLHKTFPPENAGDIYISYKKGKLWTTPELLPPPINTKSYEVTASLSITEDSIFFASDRDGGKGNMDIYMCKKLPNGSWGTPINLQEINTEWDELFPFIMPDGSRLYFSSNSEISMGGYDIFYSNKKEDGGWSLPINMGHPINTPLDETFVSFNSKGNIAYISGFRENTIGHLDLYQIEFLDVEPLLTVIRGTIFYKVPIDYTNRYFFYILKKDTQKLFVLADYAKLFTDAGYVIDDSLEKKPPGENFFIQYLVYEDKKTKKREKVLLDKLTSLPPGKIITVESKVIDNTQFDKITEIKKFEEFPIAKAELYVKDKNDNEMGIYLSTQKGTFAIILPPGDYNISTTCYGYRDTTINITVKGKDAFQPLMELNLELSPINPPAPINYQGLIRK